MKKILLMVSLCGMSTFSVDAEQKSKMSDILRNVWQEYNQEDLDKQLGVKLTELFNTPELCTLFSKLIREKFTQEEQDRLAQLFEIMIEISKTSVDPNFTAQFNCFTRAQQLLQKPDITQEEMKEIEEVLREECPLITQWLELSDKLKFFQEGLAQAVQTIRLDLILSGLLKDLLDASPRSKVA